MKKLFQKIFGQKAINQNREMNILEIEALIHSGKNAEFKEAAKKYGFDKIKCNTNPAELAAIHWAAAAGNIEIVRFLLSEEVNEDPNLTRNNHFTPLHAASMNGFTEIVELLIEKGANVNVQTDPQKYAPIHSASFGGHLETIKVLIRNGADITLRNYRDELPVDTARRQNQLETVKYFETLNS